MQTSREAVIVEPDDGPGPVTQFLASAERSLLIKQFTFTEPEFIDAVIERHRSGVAVRVMLNPARSSGDRANDETFARLQAAGVAVQWTNPAFYVTHEKSIVVDGQRAMVATYNLSPKYFSLTRDYGIVTAEPGQVAQIAEVFEADWAHDAWLPGEDRGLVWSNANSRVQMAEFIDGAQRTLDVQHPKFVDAVIVDHLAAAHERGVAVRVLCGGRHGISEGDVLDTFASLRTLVRFGVEVHKQKNLRVHAKLILVDGLSAFVGSMNIDRSAFDLRRELGIRTAVPTTVRRLAATFETDWGTSRPYQPPDPLKPHGHTEDDFPHDPDLAHE